MANITLTMPNAELTRIEDGFALDNSYESTKLVGESKHDFMLRLVLGFVTKGFANGEGSEAGKVASDAAKASANSVAITIN